MTPTPDDGVSLGELSRRLSEVFVRFEGLAQRLEGGQFVRTDLYNARQEAVNTSISALQDKTKSLGDDKVDNTDFRALSARVASLESDKTWLVRLVIGFIVMGVLGAIFIASGGGPPS